MKSEFKSIVSNLCYGVFKTIFYYVDFITIYCSKLRFHQNSRTPGLNNYVFRNKVLCF